MKINAKNIAINAIVACLYAVFTIMIAPLAYSQIQFRLSEIMVLLAFYNRKFIPGLVIGCFIANIPSTLGWLDIVFGTLGTFIVCFIMGHLKNRYWAIFVASLMTGIIVGFELYLAFGLPFIINFIYVFIGELAVLIIGVILFNSIEKNSKIKSFLLED